MSQLTRSVEKPASSPSLFTIFGFVVALLAASAFGITIGMFVGLRSVATVRVEPAKRDLAPIDRPDVRAAYRETHGRTVSTLDLLCGPHQHVKDIYIQRRNESYDSDTFRDVWGCRLPSGAIALIWFSENSPDYPMSHVIVPYMDDVTFSPEPQPPHPEAEGDNTY